ncbi:hypothetical protein ACSSS7_004632 [Eimeria intestinalis]
MEPLPRSAHGHSLRAARNHSTTSTRFQILFHLIFLLPFTAALSYVQTYASLRSLMVCNPIVGSLFSNLRDKRSFVKKLDKVVKREPPKNEKQRDKELTAVLKTLGNTLGTSSTKIRNNPSNGLASIFEALNSDAVFTIANSLLYVGTSLGYALKPMVSKRLRVFEGCLKVTMTVQNLLGPPSMVLGGFLGMILHSFFRMFNLIFFPSLLAFTSGLAVAVGVACLTGFPRMLAKAFKFVEKQIMKGVSIAYKHTQIFRLLRDAHGVSLLKEAFQNKLPKMLATLWQLGSYHKTKPTKSRLNVATLSSEVLAHSFLTGVVDFAREYSYIMEAEYLPGKEVETIRCYCEGTYRYAERFSERLRGALGFISWMSFRDAITDLLLMVYSAAKTALQAQVWGKEDVSLTNLRAAFKEASSTESFTSNVAVKPRLSRDVHNITAGVTGLVTFFELRKLYRWRPRTVGEATDFPSGKKERETRLERKVLKEGNEDISLVNQRFEAFADLDIPPDWTLAAPELEVVDDSLLPAEKKLLEKFASKRDYMMISLLRRSVEKLILAFKSIFGKLEKLVELATHRDQVGPCSLGDRRVCMNADEASKTRLTILHVMLAVHMGVFMGPGGGLAGSPEEIRQDFVSALRDAAWVRYRRRSLLPFKGRRRWGLDLLMDYLFPDRKSKQDPNKPMAEEELKALEDAVSLYRIKIFLLPKLVAPPSLQFNLERLQCIDRGALFILTTDMGDSKVFRPVSPLPPEIKEQLCIYEHEFVNINAWYQRTEFEGHLVVPGIAELKGYITDAAPILRSKQEDEDVGHLIEAVLWSKGVQRIDARVSCTPNGSLFISYLHQLPGDLTQRIAFLSFAAQASDLMVSTKRMLYPEKPWKEFFRLVSPVDLDYVQQRVSSGLQVESSKYTVKKPLFPETKADKVVNALAMALESTLILAGSLRAGLQDLALISTGYLAMEAIKLAERSMTGMARLLKTFQERLWDEFAARKQCSPEKKVSPHYLDRDGAEPQQGKLSQEATRVSISSAFAREEGHSELLFDDWCEEIYKAATNHPSEPGSANLNADDSSVIQCALLRFLGRRQELAALEAFSDPSLFPESVLIHPSTLGAFARLHIILLFEIAPILKSHEGAEIVVQMKMMPASSPAMKRLITKLETQMREAKQELGGGFKQHSSSNDSDRSLDFSRVEAVVKYLEDLSSSSSSEEEQTAGMTIDFMLQAPFLKALEVAGLSSESVGDGYRTSPLQCMPENTSSGVSYTLPVNAQSRLRMLSSMFLHLEDAGNVVDSFQVLLPEATEALWVDSIKQRIGEDAETQFGPFERPARPQDFLFDSTSIKFSEGSEDTTGPGSFAESSFIDVQQPQSQELPPSENKGKEENGGEQPGADPPTVKSDTKPTEAVAEKDEWEEPDQVKDAFDVEAENWKNAKITQVHLKQQLSNFEAHAFHFTAAFHTLLAAARLPSKVHASVLRTFRDILSIATIGEPRRRRTSWRHRLASALRRRRSKLGAKEGKKQQTTFLEVEKPSEPQASSTHYAFHSWLLPASLERIGFRIRKGWKRLVGSEFFSVRSAACEQEVSLWRDTAPNPTQNESAAAAAAADEQQLTGGAVAPGPTPQPEEVGDSRKELCSLPLWLHLHAYVTLEEQLLEEQQIFPYFVRMGIDNVRLVHKAAQEALARHLWKKLDSMKWLEMGPSQHESIRDKLRRALLASTRKHPLLEVESVRTLLVESTVDLLQQRNLTVERLQERIEGLQQTAVAQAAAHLVSVTAGIERNEADRAIGSLLESPETLSPSSSSSPAPHKEEGDASRKQHVLLDWLVQASLFRDALMLLSRPAIFTPVAALLHALHVITSPKTRVRSKLKKNLKKMRQLSSASLDMLMRLPRAYIRFPQRHFYIRSDGPRMGPLLTPPNAGEKQQIRAVIKTFPMRLSFKPRPILA